MRRIRRLRRRELPIDTIELARYLLGKTLVHDVPEGRISGRIVETEAYVIGDASGHAYRGQTRRNSSLFLDRGHAYVCFVYGSCFLVNVSSEVAGAGAGVLLRALEPLEGIEIMESARGTSRLRDLTRGPGRLAQAMCVDTRHDGLNLCGNGALWLGHQIREPGMIGTSVRIGISREVDRLYRFFERGSLFVSGPRRLERSDK